MTTLITTVPPRPLLGAVPTGPVAHALAERLTRTGEPVRILAPEPAGHGAFDGADRLFLAGAAPETVRDVVGRAVAGGVRHIVVLSSHGPEFEVRLPPERWHWLAIERAVEASGVRWTHLRPSAVLAGMLPEGCPYPGSSWAELIRAHGVIRQPFGDVAVPHLDEADLAEVAAALFDDAYAAQVVAVSGPPISARERVRQLSAATGRAIRFEELDPDEARRLWRREGRPQDVIEVTLWALERARAAPDPTLEEILGRRPRTFAEWAAAHADAFR
jgi:uncharacterized protein YbjT (DUF2867 family)